ncbi:MAG TPA: hypothetical protein DCL48_08960 [Alphaproteobacteria bacterium]|nr:hypothetical protein [Alphaproteobacteria bacterium]
MAEELTRHERILRGLQAQQLVDQVKAHIQAVEMKYHHEWARASTVEAREFLWAKLKALTDVTLDLMAEITDGDMARREQEYEDNGTN